MIIDIENMLIFISYYKLSARSKSFNLFHPLSAAAVATAGVTVEKMLGVEKVPEGVADAGSEETGTGVSEAAAEEAV